MYDVLFEKKIKKRFRVLAVIVSLQTIALIALMLTGYYQLGINDNLLRHKQSTDQKFNLQWGTDFYQNGRLEVLEGWTAGMLVSLATGAIDRDSVGFFYEENGLSAETYLAALKIATLYMDGVDTLDNSLWWKPDDSEKIAPPQIVEGEDGT